MAWAVAWSPRVLLAVVALLVGLAGCGPTGTPEAPTKTTSLPLQPHAPDIGGDIQPAVRDEIRIGLTESQLKHIADACVGASELTPGGTCLAALYEVIAPSATEPSSTQQGSAMSTCSHSDYCMTVKITTSGPDFLEVTELRETGQLCGSSPHGVCLRLIIPDAVLPQIVASISPTVGSIPATSMPPEGSTPPTTPTEAPVPTGPSGEVPVPTAPPGEAPPQPGPS